MRVLAFLLFLAAATTRLSAQDIIRNYAGYLPGTQPEGTQVILVVDGVTGLPVPKAEVTPFLMPKTPASLGASIVDIRETDAMGLAWIRRPGEMYAVRDAFHAKRSDVTDLSAPVRLYPGRDITCRLLDPLGHPTAGIVGLTAGPPGGLATYGATAGRDGFLVFASVDLLHGAPRAIAGAEVRIAGEESFRASDLVATGDLPALIAQRATVTLKGRVEQKNKVGVEGCIVRAGLSSDPWRTEADGAFRVGGTFRNATVRAYLPQYEGGKKPFFEQKGFDPDVALRILYPPLPKEGLHPCSIRVFRAADKKAAAGVEVRVTRLEDGRYFTGTSGADGIAHIELPFGIFHVSAGTPFSECYTKEPKRIEVGTQAAFDLPVESGRAALAVTVEGVLPKEARVVLVVSGAETPVSLARGAHALLPVEGEAALRVQGEGLTRFFPVEAAQGGVRRATIRWGAATEFHASQSLRGLTSPDALIFRFEQYGRVHYRTHARGRIRLSLGGAPFTSVVLPAGIGTVELSLPEPQRLSVSVPEGLAESAVSVSIDGDSPLAPTKGVVESRLLRDGAHLALSAKGYVTVHRLLSGAGPYETAWGTATLDLFVSGAQDFVLDAGGALYAGHHGKLVLRGFDAGWHTFLVGAKGCGTKQVDLLLKDHGAKRLKLALEPPPR